MVRGLKRADVFTGGANAPGYQGLPTRGPDVLDVTSVTVTDV
jgi:hypothetical protein